MDGKPTAGMGMSFTSSQYEVNVTYVTYLVNGWQKLLAVDPRRWFVRFDIPSPGSGVVYVTPGPTGEVPFVPTDANVPQEYKWRDAMPLVTGEWWGFGISPVIQPIWEVLYVGR